MATVEELIQSAQRASAAGKPEIARELIAAAKKMQAASAPQAASGPDVAMPPRAYGPNGRAAQPTAENYQFGDTVAAATEGPRQAFSAFSAGMGNPAQSPTYNALPESMGPLQRAAVGYLGDAAMTGVSALGVGIAGLAGAAGEVIGQTPTSKGQLARDLLMASQVAVPELAGVSSTTRIAGAASKVPTELTPAQAAARAAIETGVTPSLGMTGKTGAMIAAGLEKIPLAGDLIAKDAARVVGELQGALEKAKATLGPAFSAVEAGAKLRGGLNAYVTRFNAKSGEYYDKVAELLPPDTMVAPTATLDAIAKSKAAFANNPALASKLGLNGWDAVAAEASTNGMPWLAVRKFRSSIGEAIGRQSDVLGSDDLATLKSLYGALSDDMAAAAKAAGPKAYAAWDWANRYYANGARRIEEAVKPSLSAKSPEAAFEAFSAMAKADRASADVGRMLKVKASMKPSEWNAVSSSIIDRLGKAPNGQQSAAGDTFSPGVFLTQWNGMSAEAKRILLPEDVRIELDKLATVSEGVKRANLERNNSNTGTANNLSRIAIGLTVAPTTTVSALAGATVSARAMTSLPFLRALNRAKAGDAKPLMAMASGNGAFTADAREVLRLMGADAATASPANSEQAPLRAVR